MKRFCAYCGAMLNDNVKICSNCGKVVASGASNRRAVKKPQTVQQRPKSQFNDAGMSNFTPKRTRSEERVSNKSYAQYKKTPRKSYEEETPKKNRTQNTHYDKSIPDVNIYKGNFEEYQSSGKENASHIKPILSVIFKIAIILLVIYFAFAAIRIVTTSHSSCKFETEMTLRAKNYSQAFSNYFPSGRWKFSLRKNQVSYEGTSYNGDKYKMTFRHNGDYVIVETMIKNNERIIDEKVRNVELLGMFMAEGSV